MVKHIKKLTPAQEARMKEWADKWIEIGLRTGPAEREKFAQAAEVCYRAAGVAWPGNVVWVASPLVLKLAAPLAAVAIELRRQRLLQHVVNDALRDLVNHVARRAVGDDAVGQAVRRAVLDAVNSAVRGAAAGVAVDAGERGNVRDAIHRVLHAVAFKFNINEIIDRAIPLSLYMDDMDIDVHSAVSDRVDEAVIAPARHATRCVYDGIDDALMVARCNDLMLQAVSASARRAAGGNVDEAVDYGMAFHAIAEVLQAVLDRTGKQIYFNGNQFSDASSDEARANSFFRDVCGLRMGEGPPAYEATLEAAHQWYSHFDFVMACERPAAIHREPAAPGTTPRPGWRDTHRLHCGDGSAIAFQDGWGVYALDGVQIPFKQRHIVERPEAITVKEIEAEKNTEIRRLMIDRYGPERYVADSGATVVDELDADHPIAGLRTGRLLRKDVPDHEPIIYADLLNSTPEPDGTHKRYMLRIDPNAYDGEASRNLQAAVASTWRNADGSLYFKDWRDYAPVFES
jgi:hypothetical protein